MVKRKIYNSMSPINKAYWTLFKNKRSLFFINLIFKKIFRKNSDFLYLNHYTSEFLNGENIFIDKKNPYKTLKSIFCSGGCFFQGGFGIHIGKGTFWSYNVVVVSSTFDTSNYREKKDLKPIKIGENCWIGANSVILPEVEIGNNTVIGAGSVVNKSFPEGNCIIAGSPARLIRKKNV